MFDALLSPQDDDVVITPPPSVEETAWSVVKATEHQGEIRILAENLVNQCPNELPQFIINLLLQFCLCLPLFDHDDGESPTRQLSQIKRRLEDRKREGGRDDEEDYLERSPDDDYELMAAGKNGQDEENWKVFFETIGETSTLAIFNALWNWLEALSICYLKSMRQAATSASLNVLSGLNKRLDSLCKGTSDTYEALAGIRDKLVETIFGLRRRRVHDKDALIRTQCIEFLSTQARETSTPFGPTRWIPHAFHHIQTAITCETCVSARHAASKTLEQIIRNPQSDFTNHNGNPTYNLFCSSTGSVCQVKIFL